MGLTPDLSASFKKATSAEARAATLSFLRGHRAVARLWLCAMVAVAVAVQVLVWGAPKPHSNGGAVLPQLRHLFSTGYAVILLAAELAFCAVYRLAPAAVWVVVTGACVDAAFWFAHLGGLHFPNGAAAALTPGAAAVVLAVGVLVGQFQPSSSPHRRTQP